MRNKIKIVSGLLALHFASAHGLQVLDAPDNASLTAYAAQNGLTRIFIHDDRIQTIKGEEGTYAVNTDTTNGQIFLKTLREKTAITIFIVSEKGKTYQLKLIPARITAETIAIRPEQNDAINPHLNYADNLSQLMWAFVQHQLSEDAHAIHIDNSTKTIGSLHLTLDEKFQLDDFILEKYTIENTAHHVISITEKQFVQNNTAAIAVATHTLDAHQSTTLWMISHD